MDAGPPIRRTAAGTRSAPVPLAVHGSSGGSNAASSRSPLAADAVIAVLEVVEEVDTGEPVGVGNGARLGKSLVLNATMEPLCVVPARRALVLVLAAKADAVSRNGHRYRSEHLDLAAPSVVRLRRFVHVPYRRRAALSRRGVFIRDEHACQYCGRTAENVDHVVPRSRGGEHDWENVVAACHRCNSRKRDHTPAEAGMNLRRAPYAPRAAFWLVVAVGGVRPDWSDYLGDALETAWPQRCGL